MSERPRRLNKTAASLYTGVAAAVTGEAGLLLEVGGRPDLKKAVISFGLVLLGAGLVRHSLQRQENQKRTKNGNVIPLFRRN